MGLLRSAACSALLSGTAVFLAAPGLAHAAELPDAPGADVTAEVPGAGADVELGTDGGLIDLSLFAELLPPPASEVVDGAAGGLTDELPLPGTAETPVAESPAAPDGTTATTAPAPAAGGPTTTTRPRGVVDDKGTGDSGYDENLGKKAAEAPDAKSSAAAPARPKPAAAPAKRAKGRFALSGAEVGALAALGAALTATGLLFWATRWRRPGRAGHSS